MDGQGRELNVDENRWAGIIEERLDAKGYVVDAEGKAIVANALKEAFTAQDALWNGVCGNAILAERRVTLRDAARAACSLCREAAGAGPGEPAARTEKPPPKEKDGIRRFHEKSPNGTVWCAASNIWDLLEETPL
jgi:hypothetical protein